MHFLSQLGDYYRVKGVAEQPLVEKSGNILYYWFEVFRRATVVREDSCWLVSLDIYKLVDSWGEHPYFFDCSVKLSLKDVKVLHCSLSKTTLLPLDANNVSIEIVVYKGRVEASSVQLKICGFAEPPNYDYLFNIYRVLTTIIERRDPLSTPLWVDVDKLMKLKPA